MKFSVEKLTEELEDKARKIRKCEEGAESKDALSAIRAVKYALHGFDTISVNLMEIIEQTLVSAGVFVDWEVCHVG